MKKSAVSKKRPACAGRSTVSGQRQAAGKKGRGKNAFDDMRSIRKDPDLQKRIDLVVEMAKKHAVDHSVDVMNDGRHMIRHSTLKVIRVG